jgi:hypothetical protein
LGKGIQRRMRLREFRGPAPKLVFVGLSPQNHLTWWSSSPPVKDTIIRE